MVSVVINADAMKMDDGSHASQQLTFSLHQS